MISHAMAGSSHLKVSVVPRAPSAVNVRYFGTPERVVPELYGTVA